APIVPFLEWFAVTFVDPSKGSTPLLVAPEAYMFHQYPYLHLSFLAIIIFSAPLLGEPVLADNGIFKILRSYLTRCILGPVSLRQVEELAPTLGIYIFGSLILA